MRHGEKTGTIRAAIFHIAMGPSVSDGSPLDSKIGYAGDEFGEDRVRKLGVLFLFQHSPDIHELVFG